MAMGLEIADQSVEAADPAQCAFDNSSLRQHDNAMLVAVAHDPNGPVARAGQSGRYPRPLIGASLDKREPPSRLAQQRLGAVAILHMGRMHQHTEQRAHGVGRNMAFAAGGPLARIVARWVEGGPPFCPPFAVSMSVIAIVGLARLLAHRDVERWLGGGDGSAHSRRER